MKPLVALTYEISSIYSRGHEDEIQPDSAAGRKWFHTMAGRDENGRQTARRHTTGVSEEGKRHRRERSRGRTTISFVPESIEMVYTLPHLENICHSYG